MNAKDTLIIGVDGGATEVKAHAVDCDDPGAVREFRLRDESAARIYETLTSFTPVPVAEQLAARDSGEIRLGEDERALGTVWVQAAADAIADVARQCGAQQVIVGIGMPGLKTADGRGICVINNGPRVPNYLDELKRRLQDQGIELASPIAALGSDADYCGLGEEFAADGLFGDVESAYYVGCGTGVADALKLRGELVPFDRTTAWLLKAWQIPCALGPTFEKVISAKSLNGLFAVLAPGAESPYPERAAQGGDAVARACLHTAAVVLAELIFERLQTVYAGRVMAAHRGTQYERLEVEHPYRGTLLDRIVIGQRLGAVYADDANRATFAVPLEACLAWMIGQRGDAALRAHCLDDQGQLRAGLVRASRLRAAPALGAAVAAVQTAGG